MSIHFELKKEGDPAVLYSAEAGVSGQPDPNPNEIDSNEANQILTRLRSEGKMPPAAEEGSHYVTVGTDRKTIAELLNLSGSAATPTRTPSRQRGMEVGVGLSGGGLFGRGDAGHTGWTASGQGSLHVPLGQHAFVEGNLGAGTASLTNSGTTNGLDWESSIDPHAAVTGGGAIGYNFNKDWSFRIGGQYTYQVLATPDNHMVPRDNGCPPGSPAGCEPTAGPSQTVVYDRGLQDTELGAQAADGGSLTALSVPVGFGYRITDRLEARATYTPTWLRANPTDGTGVSFFAHGAALGLTYYFEIPGTAPMAPSPEPVAAPAPAVTPAATPTPVVTPAATPVATPTPTPTPAATPVATPAATPVATPTAAPAPAGPVPTAGELTAARNQALRQAELAAAQLTRINRGTLNSTQQSAFDQAVAKMGEARGALIDGPRQERPNPRRAMELYQTARSRSQEATDLVRGFPTTAAAAPAAATPVATPAATPAATPVATPAPTPLPSAPPLPAATVASTPAALAPAAPEVRSDRLFWGQPIVIQPPASATDRKWEDGVKVFVERGAERVEVTAEVSFASDRTSFSTPLTRLRPGDNKIQVTKADGTVLVEETVNLILPDSLDYTQDQIDRNIGNVVVSIRPERNRQTTPGSSGYLILARLQVKKERTGRDLFPSDGLRISVFYEDGSGVMPLVLNDGQGANIVFPPTRAGGPGPHFVVVNIPVFGSSPSGTFRIDYTVSAVAPAEKAAPTVTPVAEPARASAVTPAPVDDPTRKSQLIDQVRAVTKSTIDPMPATAGAAVDSFIRRAVLNAGLFSGGTVWPPKPLSESWATLVRPDFDALASKPRAQEAVINILEALKETEPFKGLGLIPSTVISSLAEPPLEPLAAPPAPAPAPAPAATPPAAPAAPLPPLVPLRRPTDRPAEPAAPAAPEPSPWQEIESGDFTPQPVGAGQPFAPKRYPATAAALKAVLGSPAMQELYIKMDGAWGGKRWLDQEDNSRPTVRFKGIILNFAPNGELASIKLTGVEVYHPRANAPKNRFGGDSLSGATADLTGRLATVWHRQVAVKASRSAKTVTVDFGTQFGPDPVTP